MKLLFTDFKQCRFVEVLNQKLFTKKIFGSVFNFGYIRLLDFDGLKCELKTVDAADFAKQESNIQEVTEIIWECILNQILAEVTKLLNLILTIPATFASYERSFSSSKRVND